jgi:TRAP-type mannitol/chloroaromatic compound transport system permease large subunit
MTWEAAIGLVMLLVLLGAIFIGVPISFTLLFLAFVFGWIGMGHTVVDLAYFNTIGLMKEELLAAVPLFIFMGFITEQAGLMERLFTAFRLLLAPIRGALYVVVVLTATVFAMATGIVGAAVTVLGIMASPIMIKSGYDHRLSAGAITAGGTLGILIPPSVMLIVMGPVLGVSVADLYAAAFGPGFLLAGIYVVYLLARAMINPKLGPPVPKEERVHSVPVLLREVLFGVVPLLALITATLGSILAGLATPTEAAGIGTAGAFLLALAYGGFDRRPTLSSSIAAGITVVASVAALIVGTRPPNPEMPIMGSSGLAGVGVVGLVLAVVFFFSRYSWRSLQRALTSTMATSSMVLLLAVTSNIFGAVFARLGTANWITNTLLSFQLPPTLMMIMVLVLLFLLGWPFEWPAIVLVFLPIFYPVVKELSFTGIAQPDMLVWFGALVAVTLQTAFLSPPVAMSAYYLKQVVKEWSLASIYRGMFQFMILQCICIGLVLYFPQIALWFPQTLQAAARSQKIPEDHQKIIDQQRKNPQSLEDDDWGKK